MSTAETHPFLHHPHRTIIALSIPATLSNVAEPITSLVDTAYVARLGTGPLAALGIATVALSTIFWVFGFLGVSIQTEVARADGMGNRYRAGEMVGLALLLATAFSLLIILVCFPFAETIARVLGASEAVLDDTTTYLRIRLIGAPAVLYSYVIFGTLRGLQDMRKPLWIAGGLNAINIVLDGPMIFGWGPIPAMGVGGAALASTISQWIGAVWGLWLVFRAVGFAPHRDWQDAQRLLRTGSDLFIRTGLLTLFILLTTRLANQISEEAGAAHQVIRTLWLFLALLMDGFAVTSQSLVSYFLGAGRREVARQVAAMSVQWGIGTGLVLTASMVLLVDLVVRLLVPIEAEALFRSAWIVAALAQPINALTFVTDGIHWGTGDYAFMRNTMLVATLLCSLGLGLIDRSNPDAYVLIWAVTLVWMVIRAGFGLLRVWPGIGGAPLRLVAEG